VTEALPEDQEGEMNVVLFQDGEPCAAINLAWLLGCGHAALRVEDYPPL